MNLIIDKSLSKRKVMIENIYQELMNDIDNYITQITMQSRKNILIDIRNLRKELYLLRSYIAEIKVFKDERN